MKLKTFKIKITGTIILVALLFEFHTGVSQAPQEISEQVTKFVKSLNPEQQKRVNYNFDDSLRTKWTNLPVGVAPRPGIRYGDLTAESKIQFHHILTTLLSSQGYLKTTGIMKLDDILNEVYETAYKNKEIDDNIINTLRDLKWNYTNYFISTWGTPGTPNPWGLNFGGHHISINVTVAGDNYSVTPLFLGTDPAEVHTTRYAGLRILSKEEDYGFRLVNSLSKEQKEMATISHDVPGDIITNPNSEQRIKEYQGIKAGNLNARQKEFLVMIIKEYINNLEHEKAHEYMDKLNKSGIDNIYFAWIGSYQPQKPHYYIINSPDFIIEYDNMGFQGVGNHIHSIWREKENDFGTDILKKHYTDHKHFSSR